MKDSAFSASCWVMPTKVAFGRGNPFIGQQVRRVALRLFYMLSIAFLFGISSSTLVGAAAVNLDESTGFYTIGKSVEYLATANKNLSINDLTNGNVHVSWENSSEDIPSFGSSNSVYWLRFAIKNGTPVAKNYYLELGYPLFDNVSLYFVRQDGHYVEKSIGRDRPFEKREIEHRNFVFPVTFEANETRIFYLRCLTTASVSFPLYLWSIEKFVGSKANELYGIGIFCGILLVMMLYNLIIFLSTRDKNHLYYVLYVLSYTIFQMGQTGLIFQYMWPEYPQIDNIAIPLALGSTVCGLSLFTINLLQTAKNMKLWNGLLRAIIIWSIIIMVLAVLIPYEYVIKQGTIAGIVLASIIFITARISYTKGYRPAGFFLLAFTAFFISVVVVGLRRQGIVPTNFFTEYSMLIGSSVVVSLLSLTLADKLNVLQKERDEAQSAIISGFKNQEIEIERRQELEHQNQTLEREIKNAGDQLIQAEKMAMLGQLVAGVAHDIGSPSQLITIAQDKTLEVLKSAEERTYRLLEHQDDPEAKVVLNVFQREFTKAKDALNQIKTAVGRICDIQNAILHQSQVDKTSDLVPLKPIIEECLIILRSKLRKWNVTIECAEEINLQCRRSQIGQLLTNLIGNAADALVDLGTSYVSALGKADILIRVTKSAIANGGDVVEIYIEDNGNGIAGENVDKIFDPFYTTKQIGVGTGLGLPICRKIVESHGGRLVLSQNKTMKGACFQVVLPMDSSKKQLSAPEFRGEAA